MKGNLLGGFLLRSIFWLLVCLGIWYGLGRFLVLPVAWLAEAVMQVAFPAWVEGVERSGTRLALLTGLTLPPPPGSPAGLVATLVAEADYLGIGYGLPLLLALFLASRPRRMAARMLLGAALLLPFQVWSICFTWLKQAAIQAGGGVVAQAGFGDVGREAIALGYQFGFLVLPSLAPVVIWLALDRTLLRTLLVEAYLENAEPERDAPR